MPRVRADNDARYALRASFVDGNGDAITGDTITIGGSVQDGDTVGQVTTWSGSAWTPDSSLTIDANGNVGVGTGDPSSAATGASTVLQIGATSPNAAVLALESANGEWEIGSWEGSYAGGFGIFNGKRGDFDLTIDASGDATFSGTVNASYSSMANGVFYNNYSGSSGISFASHGMDPTDNTGAVVSGTKDIGSISSKWKDAYFSGNVKADGFQFGTFCGIRTSSGTNVIPADGSGAATNGTTDLGANNYQWNVVYADEVRTNTVCSEVNGRAGFTFGSNNVILPANKTTPTNNQADLGRSGNQFKDAYFAGTVNCNTVNETSDEKAKEDIVRAPVGVIERLNGREWVWIESGKKGSGVVAQELEEVLPHLVRTDEEGRKSVAYSGLMGYLIEEVKMLREEIREIKDA